MSKRYNTQALRTLIHEELEPRLLFSADAVPGVDINAADELVLTDDIAGELQGGLDTAAETEAADEPGIELRRELVFVNENVADYEQLIAELQGSDENRILEVVVLEADRDGIEQVSEILAERSDLDAIHILSHGSDGSFVLGSDWLDSNDLAANSDVITSWGDALTEDADILLYGCNIAADEDGQNLTAILAELTGADVAASDDVTGHIKLGGDWDLEFVSGAIETEISVGSNSQEGWSHVLAPPVITSDGGGDTASINVAENTTAVTTVTATDADLDTLTYSKNGGADAALFSIDPNSGVLTFNSAPDFEAPADANTDNVYEITVQVADGNGGSDAQAISVTVTDANEAAVFTIDAIANANVAENIAFTSVTPNLSGDTPIGTLTYTLGGTDAGLFTVNATTGVVSMVARDYEAPADSNTDNIYEVTLVATDADGNTDSEDFTVTVTDVSSNLIVTTTADVNDGDVSSAEALNASKGVDGSISLSEAITAANNSPETVMISFNISDPLVGGAHTFVIGAGGLPTISDTVTIDGTTDSDYAGNPVIRLDGSSAGAGVNGLSFAATSDGSVVRGLMITGFSGYGIQVNVGADGITIANNWIGTTGTGSTGVGNSNSGINIQGANTTIGGTGVNDGNVITNNGNEGINVTGSGATGTIIQGNIIGLDPDGSTGSGNADVGIALLSGTHNTTIGGTTVEARNVISNNYEGIEINSNNNVVQGNYIGTDITGTLDRGNRSDDGVEIQNSATGNLIGGTGTGSGNLIAFSARDGVYIASGTNNTILGNQIHSNSGLGIDLGTNGVTANDAEDVDTGTNDLLNFPVLTNVVQNGADLDIDFAVDLPVGDYRIEFFDNPSGLDGTGFGEGETYIDFANISVSGAAGYEHFSTTLTGVTASDVQNITATATEADGTFTSFDSTSEFGPSLDNTAPTQVNNTGSTVTEGGTDIITNAELRYDDSQQPASSVTYSVTGGLANGQLEQTGNPGNAITSFTQAQIDANQVVYVHNGSNTTSDSFSFSVDDGPGNSITGQTFAITVTAVDDDAPVQVNNTGSSVAEGGTETINNTELRYDDTEQGAANVTYTVTGGLANGQLELTGNPGNAITSFTQDDIGNNFLVYVHNGSNTTSDSFSFSVDDGQGNSVAGQTFAITITAVDDDAPVQVNNTGSSVAEGGTDTINNSELRYDDTEQGVANVTYNVTGGPANGQLELTIDLGTAVTTFTQDDIDNNRLVYVHDDSETTSDSFNFTVDDGQGNSVTGQYFAITVTPVNDAAPVANDEVYAVDEDNTLTVDWWDTDWTRRQQLTFDNLAQTETLTDFPVLVILNSSNINYAQTKDDGSDLRFFAADGTPLAYEIEQWNEGGDSSVWVRVPQITGNSDSDSIWMYYGNAAADPGQDAAGGWDNNFVGVWHLNEEQGGTGSAGVYQDSTPYGNIGIDRVAATGQEGQVTDGQEFGANDWIEVAHDASLDLRDSMTISFWIKPTSDSGTFNRVVEKGLWGYGSSYYFGGGNGTNDLTFYLNGQGVIDTANNVLTVGVWQHAAVSYTSNGDGTGTARLYLNGAEIATGNYTNGAVAGNTSRLGIGHSESAYDFDGFIDEVQISDTDRSADWIAAQYRATKNQSGAEFVQFGGEESAPVVGGVLSNDTDVDGDPLTATLVSGPTQAASFVLNKDGTFIYTPTANYHGSDTFTYEVSDGNGGTAQATATITVNPVNDPPVRTAGVVNNLTVVEDSGLTSLGLGGVTYDPGGGAGESSQTLTYEVTVVPDPTFFGKIYLANGTTQVSTGSYTLAEIQGMQFAPNANESGISFFSFNVQDDGGTGNGGSDTLGQSIMITVNPVNDAPVLGVIGNQSIDEGATLTFTATVTDTDIPADTLTFSLDATSIAAGMTINGSTGDFSWTPTEAQDGVHSVTITVTDDGTGTLSDSEAFSITVNEINNAPVDLQATATTDGGISLNADGGNNVYYVADDGAGLLGGLTTVTIEASFSITTPGADLSPLLSYADGTNDEELALFLKSDGRIWFGAHSNGSPIQSTTGNYTQLFDGEVHHVGVSWDASSGAVVFYVDGQQVESFAGYQTGQTVTGGGELVFGQDQDSVLGGFKTWDVFSGALYDVRIFNDVRTPVEIAGSYDQTLPNTEPGMIANWTFNDLSTGGVITEAVSGNNLTEQHVVDAGFSTSVPELTFRVPEDAVNGTVVGSVSAIDPDSGETFTYSLVDNAGGRFAINGSNGQVTLANASLIDFETASSHNITIRVTDSGALTYDEVFTVYIIDVNEAPTVSLSNVTVSLAEDTDTTAAIKVADITITDDALGVNNLSLTGADAGMFTIVGSELFLNAGVTLDFESNASLDVTVEVDDPGLPATPEDSVSMAITVTDVNETVVFTIDAIADVNVAENVAFTSVTPNLSGGTPIIPVTYTLGGTDAARFTVNATTGVVSMVARDYEAPVDSDTNNIYEVTLIATDGDSNTDSEAFTVTVTDANETVSFTIDAIADVNVAENVAFTGVTPNLSGGTPIIPVTYTLGGADAARFTVNATTGVVSMVARDFEAPVDSDTNNIYEVTLIATDGDSNTDSEDFTVTVTDANEAVVFTIDAIADVNVAENVAFTSVTPNLSGGTPIIPVTYTLGGADAARFTVNATTGVVSMVARDFEAPADSDTDNIYEVTLIATDGDSNTDSEDFTVTVTDANESVVFTIDAIADVNVAENVAFTSVTPNLSGGTPIVPVTYTLGGADAARFTVNSSTGVVSMVARDFEAPADSDTDNIYEVTLITTDGDSNTDSEAFTVTVTDANESVVFTIDAIADVNVAENVAFTSVTPNLSGGTPIVPVTYTLGGADAARFTVNSSTGVVSMVARDFEAPADSDTDNIYEVTLIATDGDSNTDSEAFTVTVTDANEAVVFTIDAIADVNVAENVAFTGVTPNLSGGTPIIPVTYTLGGADAARFTVNSSTGVVSMVARDFEAPADSDTNNIYEVTLIATDGDSNTDSEAFTVTVTDANEAVVFTIDAIADVNVAENVAFTGVTPNLSGGTPIIPVTYTLGGADAARFTVNATTGVVSMVARDFEAPVDSDTNNIYEVTLIATDGDSNTDSEDFTVTVTDANEAVVFTIDAIADVNVAENVAFTSVTPNLSGGTPIIPVTYTLGGADAARFTVNGTTGVVSMVARDYEAPADSNTDNIYEVTLIATDGDSNTDSEAFTVTVTDANEAVVFTIDAIADVNVAENVAFTGVTPNLSGGTPIIPVTYTLGGADAARFTVNATTGVVSMVARDFEAPVDSDTDNIYEVTLIATDGDSNTDSEDFTVTVTDANEAVVFTIDAIADVNVAENVAFTSVTPNLSGGTPIIPVTYTLGGADAARFTVNATTGVVSMVARDFEAPVDSDTDNIYEVTLIATDGDSNTDSEDFTVTVTDANEAVVFTIDAIADVNVAENVAFTSVTPNLSGGTPIVPVTYTLGGADAGLFTVNATTGVVSMVARDFEAPADSDTDNIYEVTLIATDGDSNTDSEDFTVTVTDANESVVFTIDAIADVNVAENVAFTSVTPNLSGGTPIVPVTYTLGGADAARFTVNSSTGVVSMVARDFEAPADSDTDNIYEVTLIATDGDSNTDSEAFTVTVTDANESVVFTIDAIADVNVAENVAFTSVTPNLSGGTPIVPVTYTLGGADAARFTVNSSTGVVSMVARDFEAPADSDTDNIYEVTLIATDGDSNTDSEAFTVTVTDANEAVVFTIDAIADVNVAENVAFTGVTPNLSGGTPIIPVTYTLGGADAARFTVNATTGVVSMVARDFEAPVDSDTNNIYEVTLIATDGDSNTDSEDFTVTVTDANETVSFTIDAIADVNVAENVAFTGVTPNLSGGTPIIPVTYTLGGADAGLFTVNGTTGVVSMVARDYEAPVDSDTNNIYEVTLIATDGDSNTDSEAFTVTVTDANEAVVFTIDAIADVNVAENVAFTGVTPNLSGGTPIIPVTYTLGGADAARFTVNATTGVVSMVARDYEAPADSNTDNIYEVTLIATDGDSNTDSEDFTVTVTDANESVVFTIDAIADVNVAENVAFTGVTPNLSGGTPIIPVTYTLGGADAARFTVNATTGVVSMVARDYEAPADSDTNNIYEVTLIATDGDSNTDSEAFTVTVTDANETVSFTIDAIADVNVAENVAFTSVTPNLSGGTPIIPVTYTLGGADAARFTVNATTGVVSMVARDFEAPVDSDTDNIYEVTLIATDGDSNTDSEDFTVTVTDANESVVFTIDAIADVNVAENVAFTGVTPNLSGGTPIVPVTYTLGGADAARFTVNGTTGVVSMVARDYEAPVDSDTNNIYEVTLIATDGDSNTDSEDFTVTVTDANEAVVFTIDAIADVNVAENVAFTSVTPNLSGGTPIIPVTYTLGGADAARFTVNATTGVVSMVARDFEAPVDSDTDNIYEVTLIATDGDSNTDSEDFTVTVTDANEAVVFTIDAIADVNVAENVAFTSVTPNLSGGTPIVPVTYTLGGADAGLFTVNATTGVVSMVARDFEAPADSDTDNIYEVTLIATDGDSNTDSEDFTVTVTDANESVVFTIDAIADVNVAENVAFTSVTPNLSGGTPIVPVTYTLGGADAARFTVNSSTGVVSMVARDFEAPADSDTDNIYEVTLIATDGDSNTDSEAFTVTVTDANESVVFTIDAIADVNVAENVAFTSVTPNLSGGTPIVPVTYTLGGADAARFTVNSSTGVVSMVARDFEAPADSDTDNIYEVTLIATDGDSNTDSEAFTVTVTDANEAVVFTIDAIADVNVAENVAFTGVTPNLSGGTPIIPVTYTLGGADAARFTVNATTGVVSMVARDFEAPVDSDTNNIYEVTLIATDGDSNTDSEDFTVTVTDANEAVVFTIDAIADVNVAENVAFTGVTPNLSGGTPIIPVTYTLGGADAGLFTVNGTTGVVSMVARDYEAPVDSDTNNIYEVTLIATDGDSNTDSEAFTVTVTDANEAVVFTIDAIADVNVAENVAFTGVTPNLSGGTPIIPVTYTLGGADAARFTVNATTGVVSMVARDYEAPADSNTDNIYEVTLIATDGDSNTDSEDFTVTVTDANESVVFTIDAIADVNVAENVAFTGVTPNLSGGTPIIPVTYTLGGADAARFTVNATTGVVSMVARDYEAPADSNTDNIYEVTLIATDGDSNTDSEAFTVTVTDANEAVVFTIDAIADVNVAENVAFTGVTPNLSGGTPIVPVTYTLGGADAARFTVNATTGVVSMVARDFEAPVDSDTNNIYEVTLIATDGDSNTDSEAFTVTVTDANETVVFTIDAIADVNVAENVAFTGVTPNLSGGTPIVPVTYTLGGTDAARFTVNATTGVVSMVARDFEAPVDADTDNIYEVTLIATDGDSNTDSEAFTVTVTDANETVSFTIDAIADVNVAENVAFTGVTPNLSGGTPIIPVTYTLGGADAARFTVNATTGVVSMVARDFEAPVDSDTDNIYEVTLIATDGDSNTDSEDFTVTVTDANEAVVFTIDAIADVNVAENVAFTSVTPNLSGGTPIIPVTYTLGGADAARFTVNATTGVVSMVARDFEAPVDSDTDNIYEVTLIATDGDSNTDSEDFTVTVTDANETVSFTIDAIADVNVAENVAFTSVTPNLSGGTPIIPVTYTLGGADAGLFTVNGTTGVVSMVARDYEAPVDSDTNNIYEVTLIATDGDSNTDSEDFTVTVTDANEAVVFTIDAIADVNVAENVAFTSVTPNLSGGTPIVPVTYSLGGADAARFTVNSSTGVVSMVARDYEAPADSNTDNIYEVTLIATDGDSNTDSEAFTVTVTDANEAVVFTIDAIADVNVAENVAFTGVTPNLSGGTPIIPVTYTLGGADAARFTVNATTGVVSMVARDFEAPVDSDTDNIYEVTLVATDDGGNTDSEDFTVTVTNVNDNTPVIIDATTSIAEDAANTTVVTNINEVNTGNDTDLDGETLTYSITAGNGDGIFNIDSNTGVITVIDNSNLDYETTNQYVLTVAATDGSNSDTAAITIDVTNVNDNTPVIIDATTSIAEDAANTTVVTNINEANTGNDTDLDGETLTYSITAGNGDGIFSIDSNTGVITVIDNSNLDYETTNQYVLTVAATNGTNTDSAAVTINIADVNEAPAVSLTNVVNSLAEDTDNSSPVKIADIVITDDALGTNDLTFLGVDAASFEIVGSELFLRAGTSLDFETKSTFDVTVEVDDGAIPGTPDNTAAHTLTITDVNEASTEIIVVPPLTGDELTDTKSSTDSTTDTDPEETIQNETISDSSSEQATDTATTESTDSQLSETVMSDDSDGELFAEENLDETLSMENDLRNSTFDSYLNIKEADRYTGPGMHSEFNWSYSLNYQMPEFYSYQAFQQENADTFSISLHSDLLGLDQDMTANESSSRELERLFNDMDESYVLSNEQKNYKVKMVTGAFTTFAVGVVSYLLRAGSLMSCFLSTVPLWKGLDPIAVLVSKKKKDDKKEPSSKTDTDSDTILDKREIE